MSIVQTIYNKLLSYYNKHSLRVRCCVLSGELKNLEHEYKKMQNEHNCLKAAYEGLKENYEDLHSNINKFESIQSDLNKECKTLSETVVKFIEDQSEFNKEFDNISNNITENYRNLSIKTEKHIKEQTKRNEMVEQHINAVYVNGKYDLSGENNTILLWNKERNDYEKLDQVIPNLYITVHGNNNTVKIGCPEVMQDFCVEIHGNNNTVSVGIVNDFSKDCCLRRTVFLMCGNNEKIIVGDNPLLNSHCFFTILEDDASIEIGNDCLFGEHCTIYASDGHAVINADTKELLNRATSGVKIGNRVWCGYRCFLTKNCCLPDDTIIAAQSVVTKKFEKTSTLLAGNPASVIRTGVSHCDCTPSEYEKRKDGNYGV